MYNEISTGSKIICYYSIVTTYAYKYLNIYWDLYGVVA